jgi:transcription-repair coupling factor (superfamily II helicase)
MATADFQRNLGEALELLGEPGLFAMGELAPPAAAILSGHALVLGRRSLLIIAPGARRAEELVGDLRVVMGEEDSGGAHRRVHYFPAWDILPYEEALPDRELVGERLASLAALGGGEPCIVVATVASALQRTLAPGHGALRVTEVAPGDGWEREALVGLLLGSGYRRVDLVEEVGECAVRGGIVDAYPPLAELPVRVELEGDLVSSLRAFDPVDQRSVGPLEKVRLLPVREDGLAGPLRSKASERVMGRALEVGLARTVAKDLLERLEEGQAAEEAAFMLPLLAGEASSLFDHLPGEGRVCIYEPEELATRAERFWARAEEGWRIARKAKSLASPPEELYLSAEELIEAADARAGWAVSSLAGEGGEVGASALRSTRPETFFGRLESFVGWVAERRAAEERVGVVCMTAASAARLQRVLSEHGLEAPLVDPFSVTGTSPLEALGGLPPVGVLVGRLSGGVSLQAAGLHLVTEEELFGVRKVARRRRPRRAEAVRIRAAELAPGDYVVHADYGIGRYQGLVSVPVQAEPTECLCLEYAGGDKVYVPLEQFHLVDRYVAGDGEPSLAKLGTAAWEKTKRKVKQREPLSATRRPCTGSSRPPFLTRRPKTRPGPSRRWPLTWSLPGVWTGWSAEMWATARRRLP